MRFNFIAHAPDKLFKCVLAGGELIAPDGVLQFSTCACLFAVFGQVVVELSFLRRHVLLCFMARCIIL